jgi:hypothetical protein
MYTFLKIQEMSWKISKFGGHVTNFRGNFPLITHNGCAIVEIYQGIPVFARNVSHYDNF